MGRLAHLSRHALRLAITPAAAAAAPIVFKADAHAVAITRLGIGCVIRHVNGIVVVDDGLNTVSTVQRRGRTNAQIDSVGYSG